MKYIIMCGGVYLKWNTPRQLLKIENGETIVERTIRLLREAGVEDISISSNLEGFSNFGVPVLTHINSMRVINDFDFEGYWTDAFFPVEEPVCYIFGDVIFSPEAIKTIVETETDDIMFFASAPPFSKYYAKKYAEPFAFKVTNLKHFNEAIKKTNEYQDRQIFNRKPIAWELWQVIKATKLNVINYNNYTIINDYTCDVDYKSDIKKIISQMKLWKTRQRY